MRFLVVCKSPAQNIHTHDIQSTHEESISTYTLHSNLKLGTHLTVVVELTVT